MDGLLTPGAVPVFTLPPHVKDGTVAVPLPYRGVRDRRCGTAVDLLPALFPVCSGAGA